jgi:hypothetical protein
VSCGEVFERGADVGWSLERCVVMVGERKKAMWQQTNMFVKHTERADSEGYMTSIIAVTNKAFVV